MIVTYSIAYQTRFIRILSELGDKSTYFISKSYQKSCYGHDKKIRGYQHIFLKKCENDPCYQ